MQMHMSIKFDRSVDPSIVHASVYRSNNQYKPTRQRRRLAHPALAPAAAAALRRRLLRRVQDTRQKESSGLRQARVGVVGVRAGGREEGLSFWEGFHLGCEQGLVDRFEWLTKPSAWTDS